MTGAKRVELKPIAVEMKPLAYEVAGSGPPLILLHGLSGSGRWWGRNVPAFATSFQTYTVDLPGFGASRRVRWLRLDDTADRLADWIAAKGLSQVNVVGHSLGGAVAARLASLYPDCVGRLVLVDAAIRSPGKRADARAMGVVHAISRGSPGFAPMFMRDFLRSHPWSLLAATIDALQTDWELHLTQISAPTLVVWGEHDVITPLALGHGIAASVAGARLITLADAGHNPMWERAEVFNAEVLSFLKSHH